MNIHRNSLYFVGILIFLLLLFNQYMLISIASGIMRDDAVYLTGDSAADAQILIFSKGVPEIYGFELGVKYDFDLRDQDMMNAMMEKMSTFDRGSKKIDVDALPADFKKRYVNIGSRIACEFCCGAKTLIFPNGQPACECAHSSAMRGLALYLLKNHSNEFSDERILQELARWKSLYFPKQMMKKYIEEIETGNYTPDISALTLGTKINGRKNAGFGLPASFDSLPDMVGGC